MLPYVSYISQSTHTHILFSYFIFYCCCCCCCYFAHILASSTKYNAKTTETKIRDEKQSEKNKVTRTQVFCMHAQNKNITWKAHIKES